MHFKRIQTWCEEKNITPFEVSALEGVGITNAFKSVADECYARAQASISAEKPDGGPRYGLSISLAMFLPSVAHLHLAKSIIALSCECTCGLCSL